MVIWKRWFAGSRENSGPTKRKDQTSGLRALQLIHTLHQRMELVREALADDRDWRPLFLPILPVIRELFDARVVVTTVDCASENVSYISTGDMLLDEQLSANRSFARLCEELSAAPKPILVSNGLEGMEFADPLLRSLFPKLSILTSAWYTSSGEISFVFLSDTPGHFHLDQVAPLHYFNPWRQGSAYADYSVEGLAAEERRLTVCAPGCS